MATVTLEIPDEQDLKLVLALAERLNLRCYLENDDDLTGLESYPGGEELTVKQLRERLDAAADEPGAIPLEEFIQKMQSWK